MPPLRLFYLANGIVGSIFTLSLIFLPHSTGTFALALFGEFLFQAVSFSVQIGIVFEVIGPDNPLAATTFSFLTAATNMPVTYMMVADGHGYSARGIAGSFGLDASISVRAYFWLGCCCQSSIAAPFAQALSFRKSQTHCSKRTKKEH